ncbi:MAG: hypothetical protein Q6K26_02545, partial [Gloeomargarita sp. SZTDM-1c_bins_89]
MAKPGHLYVVITDHGLGHLTRTLAILAELRRHRPDLHLTLVTTVPQTDLAAYLPLPFTHRP